MLVTMRPCIMHKFHFYRPEEQANMARPLASALLSACLTTRTAGLNSLECYDLTTQPYSNTGPTRRLPGSNSASSWRNG